MGGKYNELQIQALSRPCSLGQLYNASSCKFLNEHLFDPTKIKPESADHAVQDFYYKEVKTLDDRSSTLDVSASLSVTIMGGAISLGGYGSYLNRKEDTTNSHTIAIVFRGRTRQEYLNVQSMQTAVAMTKEEIERTEATHVITAITYGGNVLGTLTEKDTKHSSDTTIKGGFNIEVFKGLGKAFGAEGKADLTIEEREKINSYNLEVRLLAEFLESEGDAPTNAVDLIAAVKGAGKKIGKGVPCDLVLTPISRFGDGSISSQYRDLAAAELKKITSFYNQVVDLDEGRAYLVSYFETNYLHLFPSFIAKCRARRDAVEVLSGKARKELAEYLVGYRNGDITKSTDDFLSTNKPTFTEEKTAYESDFSTSITLLDKQKAAKLHGFPLISVSTLRTEMDRSDNATVALVVVPEFVSYTKLLNTYTVLADDIRKWRTAEDKNHDKASTVYYSFYADAGLDNDFLLLDGPTQSIKTALKVIREEKEVAFLTFGLSRDNLGGLQWSALNKEGWGIIINKEEHWRYIGEVHKGKRHGTGAITYSDDSTYSGGWFDGQRVGNGKLVAKNGNVVENGIYVDNVLTTDGVIVEVTIYRDGSPVNFGRVVLRKYQSISSHVKRIAKFFDWEFDQVCRITCSVGAVSEQEVKVKGSHVDPSEDANVASSSWSLDKDGEKKIKVVLT